MGDFNSVDPEEGRLNAHSGSVIYDSCPFPAALMHELSGWAEVVTR